MWPGATGAASLLAQAAGAQAMARATLRRGDDAGRRPRQSSMSSEDDGALWARQRAGQRSAGAGDRARHGAPERRSRAFCAAVERCGGALVGRAALGISYVELDPHAIGALRAHLPDRAIGTRARPARGMRAAAIDPWPAGDGAALRADAARQAAVRSGLRSAIRACSSAASDERTDGAMPDVARWPARRSGAGRDVRALRLLPAQLPDLRPLGAARPTRRAGGSC